SADVDAQGGAYATGVLVLMSSAAVAVALAVWRHESRRRAVLFWAIVAGVGLTPIPDGIRGAGRREVAPVFIVPVLVVSLMSRASRSTELRVARVDLDPVARGFIEEASRGVIRIIANEPHARDAAEYRWKEAEQRALSCIPPEDPVLFLEVNV